MDMQISSHDIVEIILRGFACEDLHFRQALSAMQRACPGRPASDLTAALLTARTAWLLRAARDERPPATA